MTRRGWFGTLVGLFAWAKIAPKLTVPVAAKLPQHRVEMWSMGDGEIHASPGFYWDWRTDDSPDADAMRALHAQNIDQQTRYLTWKP